LQVRDPIFDPTFSTQSCGFRPHRRAHQAVIRAKRYIAEEIRMGGRYEPEKFFGLVNHDISMGSVAKKIGEKGDLLMSSSISNPQVG
jgi:RNA-directed DNA polymerase